MLPKVKCLLVDDLEENLLALGALLWREDVELVKARSGSEALELLLTHEVALAFLDVQMPDMDGFELAEIMRGTERTRNVPIIFVTAGSREQQRLFKGYELGAVDFLYKPVDPRILRNKADVFFQLERQRQQLARELTERTETLRLNEMFTAVLGHDLRNPLSAILTSADRLQLRSRDEDVIRTAARMQASAERMNRMIGDMLDLARARLAGGIPIHRQPLDLGALVQRVAHEHQEANPTRTLLVSAEGNLAGEWDADRLSQVVSNLLGNALHHGRGEQPVQVRLEGLRQDAVSLSITNAGVIPRELMPHLFQPFGSGQRVRARREGLGLGLYIVRQIVHAHRGSVSVTSDEQTTFHVELPRRLVEVLRL